MRKACLAAIAELARRDPRVVFVGSDLAAGTLGELQREFPNRHFMEGVSEQHLIGFMSGLAAEGYIPYGNTIATFFTRRCYEQIVLDAALPQLPLRLIGSGGGLVYAPLGPTHLATDDLAILRAVPGMTILAPCDADELRRLMPQTLDLPGPLYLRLAKGGDRVVSRADLSCRIGEAIALCAGGDVLLVSTGVMTGVALDAAETLAGVDIAASVLHCHTIKPLDVAALQAAARPVRVILSVEEHSIIGGLGSAVAEVVAEMAWARPKRMQRIGLPDRFFAEYGTQASAWVRQGLTVERIVETAQQLLEASAAGGIA
ncbi:MAG: transketolase [Deltaproteobacteria bacterium]|nr:transketolase [Deltaproteobacteria bacterium]